MTIPRPQRKRTVAIGAGISALIIAISLFSLFQVEKRLYENRLLEDAKQNIQQASSYILGYFYAQNNWVHLEQTQTLLNKVPNVVYSYIVGDGGKIELGPAGLSSKEIGQSKLAWEPDLNMDLGNARVRRFSVTDDLHSMYPARIKSGAPVALITSPVYCEYKGRNCGELRVLITFESIQGMIHSLAAILAITCILLISAISAAIYFNGRYHETQVEQSLQIAHSLSELSAQLAHDIKSPVAALKVGLADLPQLPEEKRVLLRTAAVRIADIANNLLERSRDRGPTAVIDASTAGITTAEPLRTELLPAIVDALVSEKRWEYRSRLGLTIEVISNRSASQDLFGAVQTNEFKRVLSNLINNGIEAVEACGGQGRVTVRLERSHGSILLHITDTGKGIPAEIIPKLMVRGASFGKENGNGLGLFHAKVCLKHWNGEMSIESEAGQGTTISMRLPEALTPGWFARRLEFSAPRTVVILDDDSSIHQIWKDRFANIVSRVDAQNGSVALLHFTSAHEFLAWHASSENAGPGDNYFYLFDYELIGGEETGLDLIEKLGLGSKSILVTSRFEDEQIRDRCLRGAVKLLPKMMAGFLPIHLLKNSDRAPSGADIHGPVLWDAVLIDDDPIIHMAWNESEKKNKKKTRKFFDLDALLMVESEINLCTPIYVDNRLGRGVKGPDVAAQLYAKGFKNLYITTGDGPEMLPPLPFLRGIIGKDYPDLQMGV